MKKRTKLCKPCNKVKNLNEFAISTAAKDGRRSNCKSCQLKTAMARYYLKKSLLIAQSTTRRREKLKDPEYRKRYYGQSMKWARRNSLKIKQYIKKIGALHTAKVVTCRLRTKKSCPKWLTRDQIAEIYAFYVLARELQWLSEEKLHVDHIVPLNSKDVCGLHVPWNLQILPASENYKKGTKIAA